MSLLIPFLTACVFAVGSAAGGSAAGGGSAGVGAGDSHRTSLAGTVTSRAVTELQDTGWGG